MKTFPTTNGVFVSTQSWLRRYRVGSLSVAENYDAAAANMVRKIGAGHDVSVVSLNLKARVAVEQYVGECSTFRWPT